MLEIKICYDKKEDMVKVSGSHQHPILCYVMLQRARDEIKNSIKLKDKKMNDKLSIKYDDFLNACPNSWAVNIDEKTHFFPFSLCELDEKSKVILCPEWLIIEKGLEGYIVAEY